MSDEVAVRAITVDAARNCLTLHLEGDLPIARAGARLPAQPLAATIEIGTAGRLLGVEVDGRYLSVSEPVAADVALARTVSVTVALHRAADGTPTAVDLPRRGADFEITYPSGNR